MDDKNSVGNCSPKGDANDIPKKRKYIKPVVPPPEKFKKHDTFAATAGAVETCSACFSAFACTSSQVVDQVKISDIGQFTRVGVSLELTRKCPLKCEHCCVEAGPDKKLSMSLENMHSWISQIAESSDHISFTGGESFVERDLLKRAIEFSHESGLGVGIVTNAYWAKTPELAQKTLDLYPVFDGLDISYDKYHSPFVQFDNIVNAVRAALERGIKKVSLRHVHLGYGFDDKVKFQRQVLEQLGSLANDPRVNCWSQPLSIGGRATMFPPSKMGFEPTDKLPDNNCCFALESIFIDTEGNVYPCCSSLSPMPNKEDVTVGNLQDERLKTVLQRLQSAFLPNVLYDYGPAYLVNFMEKVKGKEFTAELRKDLQYNDCCQLCTKIFQNKKYVDVIGRMGDVDNRSWTELKPKQMPLPQGYKTFSQS